MAVGASVLDGKAVSGAVLDELRARIQAESLRPHLHVISVGDDPASVVFVRQKRLAAEKIGVEFSQCCLPLETTLGELRAAIQEGNRSASIHGIIVQLPLPVGLRQHEREVLNMVEPAKDVDCFHPANFGRLALGEPTFLPATPAGVVRLLQHYGVETKGKRCVIVGKSNIVGKPLGLMLARENGPAATVTFCDQHTENLFEITRQADILVVAAGRHHLLCDPAALRPDGQAVVIDVGIHRVQNAEGKSIVQGDVDAEALRPHCRFLTPVPGGVGPMTVACLLEQVVKAASRLTSVSVSVLEAVKQVAVKTKLRQPLRPEEVRRIMQRICPDFGEAELDALLAEIRANEDGSMFWDDVATWAWGAPVPAP